MQIDNASFLKGIFQQDWQKAWVTGFETDPGGARDQATQARMWSGGEWQGRGQRKVANVNNLNTFFCVSTFNSAPDGKTYRRKSLFDGAHCLMADDIGTKVDAGILELYGVEPTAIIETSPGNFQYFYAFRSKEQRQWAVEQLQDGFIGLGFCEDSRDPGMKGVTRYCRLPGGVNNKQKYVDALGKPFVHVLHKFDPDVRYTTEELAAAFRITLTEPEHRPVELVTATGDLPDDKVLDALHNAGLVKGENPTKHGAYDITCPWLDEHTGGEDTGTAYFRKGTVNDIGQRFPEGGFSCHHGHCETRNVFDLQSKLIEEGHGAAILEGEFEPIPLEDGELEAPRLTTATPAPADVLETRERIIQTLSRGAGTKTNPDGPILKDLYNAVKIVGGDPGVGKLEYNLLKNAIERDRKQHADVDDNIIRLFINAAYGLEFSMDRITQAVSIVADRNSYDPVVEYLDPLVWDGKPRLDTWLIDFAGADDNAYVRAVGRKCLTGAVARAYAPGCKFDNMTVLEGPQGLRKSSLLAALCADYEWFMDSEIDIGKKDAMEVLQGKWIIEHNELAGSTKADVRHIKSFLVVQRDYYRASYARHAKNYPRHCIFFGSTNDDAYLRDETGARRFWPIKIKQCEPEKLTESRDQIWAEAKFRYNEKEPLFMSGELAAAAAREADARFVSDEWENDISAHVNNGEKGPIDRITMNEVAWEVFQITPDKLDKPTQARIAQIMRHLKFNRKQYWQGNTRVRGFERGEV